MSGGWNSLLVWLGLFSAVTFFCSAAALPFLAAKIPEDYFFRNSAEGASWRGRHPLVYWLLRIGRNLFGALLLAGGAAMLFVPGQGVLTILVGLTFLEFPGKRRIERALIRRKAILRPLNWLRRRRGAAPLRIP